MANNRGVALLSDGPNVTDLRAAVCEGQAWRATEQRGPPGLCPIRDGGKKKKMKERKQENRKTGSSPLTLRPLCSAGLRRHRWQWQQLAYFHPPYSSSMPPSKPVSLFIPSSTTPMCLERQNLSFSLCCSNQNQIKLFFLQHCLR